MISGKGATSMKVIEVKKSGTTAKAFLGEVRHPLYGAGEVLEIRRNPLVGCTCRDCKANAKPKVVMLIAWFYPARAGRAGGWYDPACKSFTFTERKVVEGVLVRLIAAAKRRGES
jgi:hypothetical protein